MEVTHSADHVTHAFMGGAQTIEFGISNSAAFFQILSSTLYSDQKLAVAREVLCNAWDAHIRAEITDVPVIVTIDDKQIIVQDKAYGIAPDRIGPLCGTYGGTDKTNNGNETGGFGLGFKSPFAYTDHFEVVSCHMGTKTIYNISKSSADKLGKPGITPIVSLPTSESGLTITIPLKTRDDHNRFIQLFDQIARNGEMNVEINGKKSDTIPLSEAESNWLITTDHLTDIHNSQIYLRYGNVIYPVENHSEYRTRYQMIIELLDKLNSKYGVAIYRIVFQAKPNTISVTPSRESLSMQEHTINTISSLFEAFFNENIDHRIGEASFDVLNERIKYATDHELIGALMQDTRRMPCFEGMTDKPWIRYINNIATFAEQYIRKNYPTSPKFYNRDITLRIDAAIELGVGHVGHLNYVKRGLTTSHPMRKTLHPHNWFKKQILRPLYRDMIALKDADKRPIMEIDRLYITTEINSENLRSPMRCEFPNIGAYLPILRKVVVISYSKKDIYHTMRNDPELGKHGSALHVWFYHAPVSKKKIEDIRTFFSSRGFIVVDYTSEENWAKYKKPSNYIPVAARVVRPKVTGFPALSGVDSANKPLRVDNCFLIDATRVNNPVCYIRVIPSKAESRVFCLGHFDKAPAKVITNLFGNVCAVIQSEAQEKKLKEAGVMQLDNYVTTYVCDRITASPSFLAYWPESIDRAGHSTNGVVCNTILERLFSIPEVRTKMGLSTNLDDHDLMVLALWQNIMENRYYYETTTGAFPHVAAAEKLIMSLPVSKLVTDIVSKAQKSSFVELINYTAIEKILRTPHSSRADGYFTRLANLTHALLA